MNVNKSVRLAVTIGVVIITLIATATAAQAHAALDSSTPTDGQRLTESPTTIDLAFTEKVTVDKTSLRVTATNGSRVDKQDAHTAGTHAIVSLPKLSPGTYVVSWHAISDDSHPVSGTLVFDVGDLPSKRDVALTAATTGTGSGDWPRVGDVVRAAMYLCLLICAGWCIFRVTLLKDIAVAHPGPGTKVFLTLGILGVASAGMTLVVQAAVISGNGWAGVTDGHSLADAAGSGVGWGVLLACEGTAALVVAWRYVSQSWARPVAVVGAGVLSYSFAVAGHSVSSHPKVLYLALTALHAGAAAVWFGGAVAVTLAVCRPRPNLTTSEPHDDGTNEEELALARTNRNARIIGGYSAIATGAIVTLLGAGLVMGWNEVRGWSALTSTSYGKALLVKVVLVGVALLLGMRNHFVLVPKIRRGAHKLVPALLATLAIEIACMAGAAGATGVLVNLVPAKTAVRARTFSQTVSFGAQRVNIVIDPTSVGPGVIHLYVLDTAGHPVATVEDLSLEFTLPSAQIGGISRKPIAAGPGHYQLNGPPFTQPGSWIVTVKGFENKFNEIFGAVQVRIS